MRSSAVVVTVVLLGACGVDAPQPDPAWTWRLPAGMPEPRVPADNPMSAAKVELGRYLFHDTRLSRDGTQSCASCHDQARAFTDGKTVPVGITGEAGRHNAMSLVNVAYNSSNTWAGHVARLEDQALAPMFGTSPVELGLAGHEAELLARLRAEPIYAELFSLAFATEASGADADADADPITIANVTRAIASFERTIISANSPFDRFMRGDRTALSPSAERGVALFESERLGCARCHGGFNLASSFDHTQMATAQVQFFNTGLYNLDGRGAYPAHDRGLIELTADPSHMGRFRAPTLRNIALTAPYFHDGNAATLDEVIAIYERGGRGDGATSPLKSPLIKTFTLTSDERDDLLAFLAALTDEQLIGDPAFASPW